MTDHARPPEGVEDDFSHYFNATGRLSRELAEAVAERDAAVARAEQAERSLAELQERYTDLAKRAGCKRAECVVLEEERDEARVNATWYQAACKGVQTERDAAVARAEQAEAELAAFAEDHQAALRAERLPRERAEAERDEARKMLGECYLLSGADPDGNDWPHLWRDAVEEVGRMRKDYDTETRRADAAEARVRQLEEALKPFAVTAPLGGDGRPEFSNEDLLARTVALWNRAAPGQDGYDNSLFSRLVTAIKAARAALSPDPSCRP